MYFSIHECLTEVRTVPSVGGDVQSSSHDTVMYHTHLNMKF